MTLFVDTLHLEDFLFSLFTPTVTAAVHMPLKGHLTKWAFADHCTYFLSLINYMESDELCVCDSQTANVGHTLLLTSSVKNVLVVCSETGIVTANANHIQA